MEHSEILNDWKKRTAVLATMHHKEQVMTPLLKAELGVEVIVPTNFNTDRFGTFTREVKRTGSQRGAARLKAVAAMELAGADMGIASEGSFGSHPDIPFMHSSLEIVLLVDARHDLEIIGHYRSSNLPVRSQVVSSSEEALRVALSWGFPQQGVIVRQSANSNQNIFKDLTTPADLCRTTDMLLSKWLVSGVCIETDMRAHRCPARMENIKQATLGLIRNCKSVCPKCTAPGFVVVDVVKGLPCSYCGLATDVVKETVRGCKQCQYTEIQPVENNTTGADPGDCLWCNP